MASRFGQSADPAAPPADLFNIWRDDYMLSPQQAAAEAAERAKNTLFDGVLPPFSNVGNTERDLGKTLEETMLFVWVVDKDRCFDSNRPNPPPARRGCVGRFLDCQPDLGLRCC